MADSERRAAARRREGRRGDRLHGRPVRRDDARRSRCRRREDRDREGRPVPEVRPAHDAVQRGVRELQPLEASRRARPQGPAPVATRSSSSSPTPTCSSRTGARASPSRSASTDDVLAATNPRLVRCFVTGFGPGGPLAAEPAFDTVLQARSGLTDAITAPGHDPSLIPGYPVDKQVGMMAVAGDPRVAVRARPDRDRRPDRGADARRRRPTSTSPTCSRTACSSTTSRRSPGTCR